MLEQNISTVNNDVKTLVKDAQALFTAATALTGEKADELRGRGMKALDTALARCTKRKRAQSPAPSTWPAPPMPMSRKTHGARSPWQPASACW
jgi:hypothetical protein